MRHKLSSVLNIIGSSLVLAVSSLGIAAVVGVGAPAASAVGLAPSPVVAAGPNCSDINSKGDEALNPGDGSTCIFQKYVNPFVKFLAALAGLAVLISVIWGGIQYSSAGGDPGKVAAARKHITQAVVALIAFMFLMAFLQWVIPGGISGNGS